MKRRMLPICLLAGGFLAIAPSQAFATLEGHEASPGDPFRDCVGVGAGPQFGAENYPNTEPEVWLAKNPANPNNFIGAIQQDRWNDGGAKGLVAPWSFNNGYKWGETPLPFSLCAAPFYGGNVLPTERASDPWVSIGPDGTAYTISISFDENTFKNGVGAATSSDGGVTWHNQKFIDFNADVGPLTAFDDKESITADPTTPNVAYAVWDQLRFSVVPSCPAKAPHAGDLPNHRGFPVDPVCFTGPAMFSKTVDGGVTWSPPMPIVTTLPAQQTISNQIVVNRQTGTLYDFYEHFNGVTGAVQIQMVLSSDKGTTWSDPQLVVPDHNPVGTHDPQTGALARDGAIIPEPAIDNNTGQLYIAFQDSRYNTNGEDDVLFSTSVAGGLTGTWTVPQRVNLPSDRAGFTPGIKVNDLGQLGIDYYSLDHPDLGPSVWPVDRFIRISTGPAIVSTPSTGQPTATISFTTPTHVGGPFNLLAAPNAFGYFVGDYEGMAIDRDGKSFHTFFSAVNCDDVNCTAPFNPTGAPEDSKAPPDPMDVYTAAYYKAG
ncbi:MAG TPA: sialidase family protein [Candidatus Dormibacteraeota bacterium]|nr:sialidase family protein [Candidatus Dormibacteraeota bacterium]